MGISRHDRFHSDLSSAAEVFSEVDNTIQGQSIKDCFRLGKFSAEARRPRPILVKFIRSADASSILSKRGSLRQPLFVKPDLSRAERVIDSLLMKERWNLIQSGTERKHIKIRNDSIYVSKQIAWQSCGLSVPGLLPYPAPSRARRQRALFCCLLCRRGACCRCP